MLENVISVNKMKIFSFKFLFCLKRTNNPTPEPDSSPAIQLPKVITFSKYSSVMITLEAQFGISPIILVNIGERILLFSVKLVIKFLSIIEFRKILMIKMKKVIFAV